MHVAREEKQFSTLYLCLADALTVGKLNQKLNMSDVCASVSVLPSPSLFPHPICTSGEGELFFGLFLLPYFLSTGEKREREGERERHHRFCLCTYVDVFFSLLRLI